LLRVAHQCIGRVVTMRHIEYFPASQSWSSRTMSGCG